MRLGLFLNFEHDPGAENAATFAYHLDLAQEAERLGFEELWVSEHHFNGFSQSPSTLPLMAYLAARTSKIRIGSAAVLLPFYDPIRLAEDLATVDLLSNGRLDFGLARGGPFPDQYAHFGIAEADAVARTREATDLIFELLGGEPVTFKGRFYQCEALKIWPGVVQNHLPTWVASGDKESIEEAARRGFGLMAGHGSSPEKIRALADTYRAAAPADGSNNADPRFMVLRNACIANTDEEALAMAVPAIERFIRGMRPLFASKTPVEAPIPQSSIDNFLAHALVGSPDTCRRKLAELHAAEPVASVVLKPTWFDQKQGFEQIRRFREEVLPLA